MIKFNEWLQAKDEELHSEVFKKIKKVAKTIGNEAKALGKEMKQAYRMNYVDPEKREYEAEKEYKKKNQ